MIKVALAGQPNCGKSTLFTMMSGVNQHIANYPGVTVEKKSTQLKYQEAQIELVDLPGTYSFSAFSMEEKAAKAYLLDDDPDVIINVVDASCLRRSLYLTFQLLEIGKPVVIVLNMMDIAKRRGLTINSAALANELGVPVIEAIGSKGVGKQAILNAVVEAQHQKTPPSPFTITYPQFEEKIAQISTEITNDTQIATRWLALKVLESDKTVMEKIGYSPKQLSGHMHDLHHSLGELDIDSAIAAERYQRANLLYQLSVTEPAIKKATLTSLIDKVVLNRWCSFFVLGLIIFGTYELAIVKGYELTNYTWPYLAMMKNAIISALPDPQFIQVPLLTELGIWLVNSMLALLNYIPIFLILFIIIAILEDVGYMPRIAFVLDRVFKRYGLHGQSTLPLVLGGAFVGGCAVPGIMATKGIADEQARIATALTVPYMNCLAKVPFYTLILGAFFAESMSLMMFFISTVTLFIALSVARVLTLSFLKHKESAPFIMELPPYHIPTLKGVMLRSMQRIWMYIYKVGTIVMAVAVVLFVLLQFPGVSSEKQAEIDNKAQTILRQFDKKVQKSPYYADIQSEETVFKLINLYNNYRSEKMTASQSQAKAIDEKYAQEEPVLFKFVKPTDNDSRQINREIRKLSQQGQLMQNELKNERITNSFLGMFGRYLEPVTQWAGFDWRINVAFLSSFAARESAVATIGSIYESGKTERAESAFGSEEGYTSLHAAAMLIFMIFTPPCIASMVVVKLNVNSYKLMLLAIFMPFTLGLVIASLFFTLGSALVWSGTEMMGYFYATMVILTILLGLIKRPVKRRFTEQQQIYVRQQ